MSAAMKSIVSVKPGASIVPLTVTVMPGASDVPAGVPGASDVPASAGTLAPMHMITASNTITVSFFSLSIIPSFYSQI